MCEESQKKEHLSPALDGAGKTLKQEFGFLYTI